MNGPLNPKRKKGITPLMATLLLISFAVAVGTVVMNFARAQVDSQAQCSINPKLGLAKHNGLQQICFDSSPSILKFGLQNGFEIDIEGLVVSVIGTQRAETFELNEAVINRGSIYRGSLNYDSSVLGTIRQVKISPKITLFEEQVICVEYSLVLENIGAC